MTNRRIGYRRPKQAPTPTTTGGSMRTPQESKRELLRLHMSGMTSPTKLAELLNAGNFETAEGGPWTRQSVSSMIRTLQRDGWIEQPEPESDGSERPSKLEIRQFVDEAVKEAIPGIVQGVVSAIKIPSAKINTQEITRIMGGALDRNRSVMTAASDRISQAVANLRQGDEDLKAVRRVCEVTGRNAHETLRRFDDSMDTLEASIKADLEVVKGEASSMTETISESLVAMQTALETKIDERLTGELEIPLDGMLERIVERRMDGLVGKIDKEINTTLSAAWLKLEDRLTRNIIAGVTKQLGKHK